MLEPRAKNFEHSFLVFDRRISQEVDKRQEARQLMLNQSFDAGRVTFLVNLPLPPTPPIRAKALVSRGR
jgi:hypothetical protein